MAVALQVLKIIGIVLLCVVGSLLLLLLLLLFWPYGYRIRAAKREKIRAQAGITWLFHFMTADLLYEDGVNLRIRLLGIPVYDKKRKAEKAAEKERKLAEKEAKKRSRKPESISVPADTGEHTEETVEIPESKTDTVTEHVPGEKKADPVKEEPRSGRNRREKKHSASRKKKERRKISFSEWWDEITDRIGAKAETLAEQAEDGVWQLGDTIDKAFDTCHYYERVLESEGAAWVVAYVKKHGLAILKPLKPTRFDLDLDYRSTDPVQIAKVMEYYALSIPLTDDIRGNIRVTALPDEDLLEGETRLKGHFILGSLLWHAFLLWKNKKVRHFIKVLKREQDTGH